MNGRLLRRSSFPALQIVTLNLLVPVLRKADRFFPAPPLTLVGIFGKAAGPGARPQEATEAAPQTTLFGDGASQS